MRIFCRNKLLFFAWVALILDACTMIGPAESEEEKQFFPQDEIMFNLYPNDEAVGDSIDANLAYGVAIPVHPKGHYELSFDVDEYATIPRLQLFRVFWSNRLNNYSGSLVRSLKPEIVDDRYVFSFDCKENEKTLWVATLNDGKDFYAGRTKNVRLSGEGSYSDHMSLNLIVVGSVKELDVSFDSLATVLKKKFRKYYSTISLDTVYVRYANEHPSLGKKYPSTEPWVAGRSSDDQLLTELGGWPESGVDNALDVVLVHRFDKEGLLGLSDVFGANMGGGVGSTVAIANHFRTSGKVYVIPADSVVFTALHEIGHFFGLRHTTATSADQSASGDYSIFEDGLDDTPNCVQKSLKKSLFETIDNVPLDYQEHRLHYASRYRVAFEISECPDASNMMFPLDVNVKNVGFSSQQLDVIRKNLQLMPH